MFLTYTFTIVIDIDHKCIISIVRIDTRSLSCDNPTKKNHIGAHDPHLKYIIVALKYGKLGE